MKIKTKHKTQKKMLKKIISVILMSLTFICCEEESESENNNPIDQQPTIIGTWTIDSIQNYQTQTISQTGSLNYTVSFDGEVWSTYVDNEFIDSQTYSNSGNLIIVSEGMEEGFSCQHEILHLTTSKFNLDLSPLCSTGDTWYMSK